MTRAEFFHDGPRFTVRIYGHADYREDGNDIVCAAVSMLAQAFVGWLQGNQTEIPRLNIATCEPGSVEVEIVVDDYGYERVQAAFEMTLCGFELLEEKYPNHVSVGRNFQNHSVD